MEKYLSVTTLTKYLKMKFDKDPYLERVYLTGQVSNFRKRPTHQYFSLKDDHAVIQATIWSGIYQKSVFVDFVLNAVVVGPNVVNSHHTSALAV